MNPYEIFQVDEETENKEGVVLEYPVKDRDDKAFRVRIVHAGDTNPAYRDYLRARLKPLNFKLQHDLASDEELLAVMRPVFAEKIIKSWEVLVDGVWVPGIYGDNFDVLPVTKENMVNVLTSAPRLFKDIRSQAESLALFKSDNRKASSKN